MMAIDIDGVYWNRTTGERVVVDDFFTAVGGAYPGMQIVGYTAPGNVFGSMSLNRFRENYYR